jgi:glycosyltransferase involved in cell wall biosynthesis
VDVLYVGSLVPDTQEFWGPAFSRAGNMFQENLVYSLSKAGMGPSLVLSQHPMPAYPRSRKLVYCGGRARTRDGLQVRLIPFVNLPLLRQLTAGLAVTFGILMWGLRRPGTTKVVYVFNLSEPSGLFVFAGGRLARARVVASVNDINVPGQTVPSSGLRKLDFILTRALIPKLDGLVVVSSRIVRDFAPKSKFVRVEGGMRREALDRLRSGPRRQRTGHGEFTAVAAGSLDSFNGIPELVEAFDMLKGRHYRLRIAGDGPLKSFVEEAARSNPAIEYCGYLTLDGVLALYSSADLLVNMRITKRINTDYFFPSKLVEYMATGIPVITTATGHVRSDYADLVFLLEDEAPHALAGLIDSVARMEPAERLSRAIRAQEFVAREKTWERQGERIAEFIRTEVVRRGRDEKVAGEPHE